MPAVIGDLFLDRPDQWGMRGDTYLWDEMAAALAHDPLPASDAALHVKLADVFRNLTGTALSDPWEMLKVERLAHGGMSSGCVYREFWLERAIPLLTGRAGQLRVNSFVGFYAPCPQDQNVFRTRHQVRVAAWNLNHRVGTTPFRQEVPAAAMALSTEVLVFNEFYPGKHEHSFRGRLADAGWSHQVMSSDTGEKANRVLIASRLPIEPLALKLPAFDGQFSANIAAALLPDIGLNLIGLRVPMYQKATAGLLPRAWDWLETTARALADVPAVIVGDLNASVQVTGTHRKPQFERILASAWRRAEPADGPSWFGRNGAASEIDHVLHTRQVHVDQARFVRHAGGYSLAGTPGSLSDHAALRFVMWPAAPVESLPVSCQRPLDALCEDASKP